MTRDEAHKLVPEWIDEYTDESTCHHYGKCELHRDIDRIYDGVEKIVEQKDEFHPKQQTFQFEKDEK